LASEVSVQIQQPEEFHLESDAESSINKSEPEKEPLYEV